MNWISTEGLSLEKLLLKRKVSNSLEKPTFPVVDRGATCEKSFVFLVQVNIINL